MWSSKQHDERHIDIACRRSTPNGLDDDIGAGLGEVNLLLEQRFSRPVAPPPHLSWQAVEHLILSAPKPAAPIPWYRVAFQPGQLAMASATAALVIALFTSVPLFRTSVPALEGIVYARGPEKVNTLPPPEVLLPELKHIQKSRRLEVSHEVRVEHPAPEFSERRNTEVFATKLVVPESTEAHDVAPTELQREVVREYMRITQTEDISTADMVEKVRALNLRSDEDVRFFINAREITLEERITGMERFQQQFGGKGFLPQVRSRATIELERDGETKSLTFTGLGEMSEEELQRMLFLELQRLHGQDAVGEEPSPRTTGRQK